MTETNPTSAKFVAGLPVSTTDSVGVLLIADGDSIVATYVDADDGNGNTNVTVTDNATVDCTSPVISNVAVSNVTATTATVDYDVDEPTTGRVDYGTVCGTPSGMAPSNQQTHPTVVLNGLADGTTYFFTVTATDPAANVAIDDNGGACFTFETEEVPDAFTEEFGPFDMAGPRITYRPDGSFSGYEVYTRAGDGTFPNNQAGGTKLAATVVTHALVEYLNDITRPPYGV